MRKYKPIVVILPVVLSASLPPAFSVKNAPSASPDNGAHSQTRERSKHGVHVEVVIKAPASDVWRCMQEQRKIDPDSHYIKTTNVSEQLRELEQKFIFPSPFGDAECLLKLVEKPGERVDYCLKQSEDLKAMEGSWVLTPLEGGASTRLSLTSYVEPGIYVPRMIVNGIIHHRVERNLNMVKRLAEGSRLSMVGHGVQ